MRNIVCALGFIIISFIGCSGTTAKKNYNPEKVISIKRFDKDIYDYLKQPEASKETILKEKYPVLLPAFGRIAMDNSDPSTFFTSLREYFSHNMLNKIYKDALSTFSDVSAYEKELSSANTLVAEYFPGKSLPELAMHVSGFRENVIILNNLISISTDKYLGEDYQEYSDFFEPFERQQMQSKYLVRDYIKAWLMSDIIKGDTSEQSLLAYMVYEGKILYALSRLLPDRSANDIIGYTPRQLAWCTNNEKNVWQKLVKGNYLFSTDHMIITRLINDAPYTGIISQESPGRTGAWIGWQIVNKYAEKKNASLEEIIRTDARTILKEAKYNP
ncbi:gliding motility lipoprotein GldB [Bacteroidia bacterium]|nr:gliding motility lipoprotein GldB [Bacteroidia bacterium]